MFFDYKSPNSLKTLSFLLIISRSLEACNYKPIALTLTHPSQAEEKKRRKNLESLDFLDCASYLYLKIPTVLQAVLSVTRVVC